MEIIGSEMTHDKFIKYSRYTHKVHLRENMS